LLSAQNASEMVGGVAYYRGGITIELFNEKASAHAMDCSLGRTLLV
jgi:hypothetical protein